MTPFRENVLGAVFGKAAYSGSGSLLAFARRFRAGFVFGKAGGSPVDAFRPARHEADARGSTRFGNRPELAINISSLDDVR